MNFQRRYEKLLAAVLDEITQEHKLYVAKSEQERALALVKLEAIRDYRNEMLKKWELFPEDLTISN